MAPTKKALKNLTINNLPTELVDKIKVLAIEFDCTITDLVTAIFHRAVQDTGNLYLDVHRLLLNRKKEREDQAMVEKELYKLQKAIGTDDGFPEF